MQTSDFSTEVLSEAPNAPEKLIRFETAAEFRSRPSYRENLHPEKAKPWRIIGGYGFRRGNWVKCGFCTCKREHGPGYVIRNADGHETNIGHCCGKTMFGTDWIVMHDQFETQRKVQALHEVRARVLATREAMLKQANAALAAIEPAANNVKAVLAQVNKFGPVKRAFEEVVKQRGSLAYHRTLTSDERAFASGQGSVRESKGHIDGIHAATVDAKELARQLRFRVVVPLTDLQPESLFSMQVRELEEKLRFASEMAALIQQAELYAEDAVKLARPINWHRFEQFCDASKVKMQPEGYTALRTLAGTL